ncbi:MAG: hypothetical protein LBK29_02165 [Oscillospiraceae bacterium]|jgi:small GTP-binding protein|nr:hypothetical protein [Oscillospiraceae bacterium]
MKNSLFRKFISSVMTTLVLFPAINTRVNADPLIQVAFLGNSKVGKTKTFNEIVYGTSDSEYRPTVGVYRANKVVKKGESEVELKISDISGQEIYRALVPYYLRDVNVIVIFTDLQEKNIEKTEYWFQMCREDSPDAKILFAVNCYPPSFSQSSDQVASRMSKVENQLGIHRGEITIFHVDPSKTDGCKALEEELENLAFECAKEGKVKPEIPLGVSTFEAFGVGSSKIPYAIGAGSLALFAAIAFVLYGKRSNEQKENAKKSSRK